MRRARAARILPSERLLNRGKVKAKRLGVVGVGTLGEALIRGFRLKWPGAARS